MQSQKYFDYINFSPVWKAKCKEVWYRCGGICERCNNNPVEATHHLHYRYPLGEEPLEVLLGVCNACHSCLHGRSIVDPKVVHTPDSLWEYLKKNH